MISEHSETSPQTSQPAISKRRAVAAIADRIRRYNSDIDPGSDTFRAAVVLLAASEFGQNIDVLARCTGFDRAFVARCARRLTDNGVWVAGNTVAEWSTADEASGTFWNDVAVAEGKMCRRGAGSSVEWAPAGFWNKGFHFNDPEAQERSTTLYCDAVPAQPSAPTQAAPELIGESESVESPAEQADSNQADPIENSNDTHSNLPLTNGHHPHPVPRLNDVFPDVIWIG